jgi:hypothetical protein
VAATVTSIMFWVSIAAIAASLVLSCLFPKNDKVRVCLLGLGLIALLINATIHVNDLKSLAPRTLTVQKADDISDAIKSYSGTHFDVAVDPAVELDFTNTIINIITSAGWKRDRYPNSSMAYPEGVDIIIGRVALQLRLSAEYPDLNPPASALASALTTAGIETSIVFDPPRHRSTLDAIQVEIGRKP